MEVEDEELNELCAEILENWNTPIYSDAHQNPFSPHYHQPLNTPYDVLETKISMSKLKYNSDSKQEYELKNKDKRILAPKTSNYQANKKMNSDRSMEQSIIPVLVADTFYDKLRGNASDGIDLAALNYIKTGKARQNKDETSRASKENGKTTDKLSSDQCNFPMENRMAKRSPIRSTGQRGFVANSSYKLPLNKTIFEMNIDDFGEKKWRNPGVDLSDFFNYGLCEKQWRDYCELMQAQIRTRRIRRKEIIGDEGRESLKGGMISEVKVKLNKEKGKYLPFRDSKDSSSYNSNVIIEIALCDSSYKDEIRRQLIRKYGVLPDNGRPNLCSNSRNTPNVNCRMINGERISPFPMDNYSVEEGELIEEQSQQYYQIQSTKSSWQRRTELSITHSEIELTGSNDMGKQGKYSVSHDGERGQKRVRLFHENQSHEKVDLNLVKSFYSPRVVESVREYYVSQGVQKEYFNTIFPNIGHSSAIKMKVEEHPEKLKRRKERFSRALPILKNVEADVNGG